MAPGLVYPEGFRMRAKGPHKAYALLRAHHLAHALAGSHRSPGGRAGCYQRGWAAADRHNVHVLAQAVLTEHVHVLVSYRPDTALAAFVRDAKSESSRLAGPNATWCRGYYAGSVCENHLAYTVST